MQFRGHFLPMHQSMSVSWAFTLSPFVSQIRLRDFFQLLVIGMCHFLPVHHFGMACLVGSKVNIQHPEDLPEAMNDSDNWRERVRDIRASEMMMMMIFMMG